tara:strand:- start:815 stop:1828 length:1014 start_codon:yes stop_codon:yes gene_type:complete
MNKKPNIALLGCGYWGKNLARNFSSLGVLKMICDPSEGGRNLAAELAPEAAIESDFNIAFQDPTIDAVAIATPAETHCDLAILAMEAGKDVFVEKPLALNFVEGRKMGEKARDLNRILMVGHLLEYHPAILRLRELIDEGELGHINYIYSNRLNFGKVRTEENALWSFAPHDIAIILRLIGEMPLEVTCVGGSYITPNLADVTVSNLHFPTGVRAHVFVSWLNPFKEQKLVVVGDRKMAVFDDTSQDEKLVLFDQRVDVEGRSPILQKRNSKVVDLKSGEPLRSECEHFIECVTERKTPLTDARSGNNVLEVLQACEISQQLNGTPTLLSEISSRRS